MLACTLHAFSTPVCMGELHHQPQHVSTETSNLTTARGCAAAHTRVSQPVLHMPTAPAMPYVSQPQLLVTGSQSWSMVTSVHPYQRPHTAAIARPPARASFRRVTADASQVSQPVTAHSVSQNVRQLQVEGGGPRPAPLLLLLRRHSCRSRASATTAALLHGGGPLRPRRCDGLAVTSVADTAAARGAAGLGAWWAGCNLKHGAAVRR
mmetsp:Transcript_15485/g.38563  ORF Transcript_15485/g.38563 Transcript_15485/m.38563 type:complete len:208 (-) Transcript_15485:606-1229(-)